MRGPIDTDGPPDEVDPGTALEQELGRLVHHPHQEAARLHDVAEAGETGATPYIEIATVARYIIPFVLLLVGIALAAYYVSR